MSENWPQPQDDFENTMPFVPPAAEIGDAERVYELSDDDRSIVRVLAADHPLNPSDTYNRHATIDQFTAQAEDLSQELAELRAEYGIETPDVRYVIGAIDKDPDAVALYGQVERVQGDNLTKALDEHTVPDEIYDKHLVGQVKYAMDNLLAGTPFRNDILGRDVQYMYGRVSADETDKIYLVDVGDKLNTVPPADVVLQSGRRSADGTRKPPYSPLQATIANTVYSTIRNYDERSQQGYELPEATEAIEQARTDLLQRWPELVRPLEERLEQDREELEESA